MPSNNEEKRNTYMSQCEHARAQGWTVRCDCLYSRESQTWLYI